tara:strand:- start:164 stop:352 length:189 start_codon:yes stop_codon:yes gene_type:complete
LNDFNFEPIVEVRAASEARNRNERKLTFVPFAASGKEGSTYTFAADVTIDRFGKQRFSLRDA